MVKAYVEAAQAYRNLARKAAGAIDPSDQRAHHGFAWIATSVAALEAVSGWVKRESELDRQVAQLAFAETIAQLIGGLPMGQNELLRPADLGLDARELGDACADLLRRKVADGSSPKSWA